MSGISELTSSQPWVGIDPQAANFLATGSSFIPTGPGKRTLSTPTGWPLDTFHQVYKKTNINVSIPTPQPTSNGPPTATFTGFYWAGNVGSTSAAPTWTWTTTGSPTSIAYTVLSGSTSTPSVVSATGTLSGTATSFAFSGATQNDYYYKLQLVLSPGSITVNSTVNQNHLADPKIAFVSFAFAGVLESATPIPTWTWTLAGGGAVASQTAILYTATAADPTTFTLLTSPSLTSSQTTYQYPYTNPSVQGAYFKLVVNAINATSTQTMTNVSPINGLPISNYQFASFAYAGTTGSTSALPTWTFTNSGGAVDLLRVTLETSTDNVTYSTLISLLSISTSSLSYQYTGATVPYNFYRLTVLGSDSYTLLNSTFTNTSSQNGTPPPSPKITLAAKGSLFYGNVGTTSALPSIVTWYDDSGPAVSILYCRLYTGTTSNPTTLVDTQTIDTTLVNQAVPTQSSVTTVIGNYYRFILTATYGGSLTKTYTYDLPRNKTPTVSFSQIKTQSVVFTSIITNSDGTKILATSNSTAPIQSTDSGSSWFATGFPYPDYTPRVVTGTNAMTNLCFNCTNGIITSVDSGNTCYTTGETVYYNYPSAVGNSYVLIPTKPLRISLTSPYTSYTDISTQPTSTISSTTTRVCASDNGGDNATNILVCFNPTTGLASGAQYSMVTNNAGSSWTLFNFNSSVDDPHGLYGGEYPQACCCTPDFTTIYAFMSYNSALTSIQMYGVSCYVSRDSGATWTRKFMSHDPLLIRGARCSADGSYVVLNTLGGNNPSLLISTNYGDTFAFVGFPYGEVNNNPLCVALASSTKQIYALGNNSMSGGTSSIYTLAIS
jgi:hypothetical protein